MSALNKFLLLLLVGQLGLAGWIYGRGNELSRFEADRALLPVDMAEVDRIVIEEKGKEQLTLVRKQDQWVLPQFHDFPVSPRKMKDFMEKLEAVKPSWPVGQTISAAEQLKVGEDNFENRIRLHKGGETLGVLLLGSSPSFRKVHARLQDDERTYAIDFDRYQARSQPADWYDRSVLKFPSKDVSRIDMGAFALKGEGKAFVLEDLSPEEQVRSEAVAKHVAAATGMNFESVMQEDGKETFEKGALVLQFTLETGAGEKIRYTVTAPEESEDYLLKTSHYPHYFTVKKSMIDQLRTTKREELVEKREAKGQETQQSGGESGSTVQDQPSDPEGK